MLFQSISRYKAWVAYQVALAPSKRSKEWRGFEFHAAEIDQMELAEKEKESTQ
jgi:hypothetical protein